MPTFRKFLKKFAPSVMGSWVTRHSRSRGYAVSASNTSTSRFNRQQKHRSYSQFDDVEMDRLSDRGGPAVGGNVVEVQGIAPGTLTPEALIPGHSGTVDCEARSPTPDREKGSQEAIVDSGGIAYTKTFQVQYSNE